MYFIKTPQWLKRLYAKYVWHINTKEKVLYLTFDDGPHPLATPFVLGELKKYDAKGTFFCIGKNVVNHGDIYNMVINEGHSIGNHTQNHLNGWKTDNEVYLENVSEASKHIESQLFRPPYGRIKRAQGKHLLAQGFHIIMWDVISADFDESITPEACLENVLKKAKPGSIIVFHDSQKAFQNMKVALPGVLNHFSKKGYYFKPLTLNNVKGPE